MSNNLKKSLSRLGKVNPDTKTQHDSDHIQRVHDAEMEAHRKFARTVLQPIKDKLEAGGVESLTSAERVIVDARRDFFYREEEDGTASNH